MKVYASHTPRAKAIFDLLYQSAEGIQDVEVISCPFEGNSDGMWGETGTDEYQYLMIQRWNLLPTIIRENIGSNIVWLDVDCVFNSNNKTFAPTINSLLEQHDFAFHYDSNSALSRHINTGIMAIKCSKKTLAVTEKWIDIILNMTPEARRGIGCLAQWNDIFSNYPEHEATYCILPQDFGYRTSNCVIYHAIGVQDKITHLNDALNSFQQG
tara:strand:+ start:215 stop:850 length:636 start_codon:yes stop_codon:yes gene_type:complete